MSIVPPTSAAASVARAAKPPIHGYSPTPRAAGQIIAGAAAMSVPALVANAVADPPAADGTSPDRTDRLEARATWSGPGSVTQYPVFGAALLSIPMLYTRMRAHLTPTELKVTSAVYHSVGVGGLASLIAMPAVFAWMDRR